MLPLALISALKIKKNSFKFRIYLKSSVNNYGSPPAVI